MKVFSQWRRFLFCVPILIIFLHLTSVLELQQNSSPQELHKKQEKFDHLVLGPAAGEGLRDRLQCQGTKALSKTHLSTSSRRSSFGNNVVFATVFTTYKSAVDEEINGQPKDLATVGNTTYTKVERSMTVLNVFINFIQMTMPQSEVIILTDPASELPIHRDGVIVHPIPGEYSRDKLMLQRIKSYIAFLQSRLQEHHEKKKKLNHYIFTDSDIAVVDELDHIFHEFPSFDVALTFRNNKQQPLNSGFIAVRGTIEGITRANAFLQEVLRVYTSKYMKASRMLGDQLALAWVVQSHPSFDAGRFTRKQPFLDSIGGTSVLFLPCLSYNWTPPEGAGQFHGMPLDVKVLTANLNDSAFVFELHSNDSYIEFNLFPDADSSFQRVTKTTYVGVLELSKFLFILSNSRYVMPHTEEREDKVRLLVFKITRRYEFDLYHYLKNLD